MIFDCIKHFFKKKPYQTQISSINQEELLRSQCEERLKKRLDYIESLKERSNMSVEERGFMKEIDRLINSTISEHQGSYGDWFTSADRWYTLGFVDGQPRLNDLWSKLMLRNPDNFEDKDVILLYERLCSNLNALHNKFIDTASAMDPCNKPLQDLLLNQKGPFTFDQLQTVKGTFANPELFQEVVNVISTLPY